MVVCPLPIVIFAESGAQSAVISVSLATERVLYAAPKPSWTVWLEFRSSHWEAWVGAGEKLNKKRQAKATDIANRLVFRILLVCFLLLLSIYDYCF
ncbi:hypothetical protein KAI65_06115 [Candidatus Parcubacteria bacterium]|nr:hypothetical protein [Candidatus Parcubacteria bacterium]